MLPAMTAGRLGAFYQENSVRDPRDDGGPAQVRKATSLPDRRGKQVMSGIADYDVIILGGGLAGLSLARQILLETDKTVLLLEKRDTLPPVRQKVGESLVQLGGYYMSKVLDLEEYLITDHLMKYNLRFYWHQAGRVAKNFEELSQGYIRPFSNIASYQLDRNRLEGALLSRNREDPRFHLVTGVNDIQIKVGNGVPHVARFRFAPQGGTVYSEEASVKSQWLIDSTGRSKLLARRMSLCRENVIRHGSFFWWVKGLVDIERLTNKSPKEIRRNRNRVFTGHLPTWLATNHFMKEGIWFWVIPLKGKTSLGLVYDRAVLKHEEINSVEKATKWVCREFPLFAHDLPNRQVLDYGGFKDQSYDCQQTISPNRWAMTGESGRFTDPLYSPGSDLISIYNTLIVDAIKCPNAAELEAKCGLFEELMRAAYEAYVPSYAKSYDALGDQETFCLKYGWELTIYFAGYVFPFINDLFTDRRFVATFLRLFSRLGPVNASIQQVLSGYFHWKKAEGLVGTHEAVFFDFRAFEPLCRAETMFYEVGVNVDEARKLLFEQLESVVEFAQFIVAYVVSRVIGDDRLIYNKAFVDSLNLQDVGFDLERFEGLYEVHRSAVEAKKWSFDPEIMRVFSRPYRQDEMQRKESTA